MQKKFLRKKFLITSLLLVFSLQSGSIVWAGRRVEVIKQIDEWREVVTKRVTAKHDWGSPEVKHGDRFITCDSCGDEYVTSNGEWCLGPYTKKCGVEAFKKLSPANYDRGQELVRELTGLFPRPDEYYPTFDLILTPRWFFILNGLRENAKAMDAEECAERAEGDRGPAPAIISPVAKSPPPAPKGGPAPAPVPAVKGRGIEPTGTPTITTPSASVTPSYYGGWIDHEEERNYYDNLNPEKTKREKIKVMETLRKDIEICKRILCTGQPESPYVAVNNVLHDLKRWEDQVESLKERYDYWNDEEDSFDERDHIDEDSDGPVRGGSEDSSNKSESGDSTGKPWEKAYRGGYWTPRKPLK